MALGLQQSNNVFYMHDDNLLFYAMTGSNS